MLFGGSGETHRHRQDIDILKDGIVIGSNEETYEYEIEERRSASSVVLNQSRLWVTGGYIGNWNKLNTSQFLSLDQPPEKGPDLPFAVSCHCMVQVDSETIYLIGGFQNGEKSNKTWIINPKKNFQIREGPTMLETRIDHACATMKVNNKVFIIVVGSADNRQCRTIEILDTTLPSNNWKFGMY